MKLAQPQIPPKNPSAEKFWGRSPSRRAKRKGWGKGIFALRLSAVKFYFEPFSLKKVRPLSNKLDHENKNNLWRIIGKPKQKPMF